MTGQHLILTPEKVVVSFTLATLGSRIWAKVIDLVVLYILLVMVLASASFLILLLPGEIKNMAELILAVIGGFGIFLYFIGSEVWFKGQTVGKKALGIRVMMVDGTPLTFMGALYRNLILIADLALPFIGLTSMFITPKCQRVGDLASGTLVVHDGKPKQMYHPSPHREGVHPMEEKVGDLRGMTMEEYLAIKRLCDRFPELPNEIQQKSIEEVWVPFAERFKIPDLPNVHPIYLMEATVMKYGRIKKMV